MERNKLIAMKLVRIAKRLVAFSHDPVKIGDFIIFVKKMYTPQYVNGANFICVDAPHDKLMAIRDGLKSLGFKYDSVNGWHCVHTGVSWHKVENMIQDCISNEVEKVDVPPVSFTDIFTKELVFDGCSETGTDTFSRNGREYTTSPRRECFFHDEEGNKYSCFLLCNNRNYHCGRDFFWNPEGTDFDKGLHGKIGSSVEISGNARTIKKTDGKYIVTFLMR